MTLFVFTESIGSFHVVFVHLPIGMLLLALLMQWLSVKEKYAALQPAISIAYLAGSIAAVMSCITGWMLASGGEYDESTLYLHRWMGISVAVMSIIGYYFTIRQKAFYLKWLAMVLFVLILITGHLGGTLTHGDGFLTKGFSGGTKDSMVARKIIPDAQDAVVFTDIIQPVFQEKCYSCHGGKKQKGGLRLDSKEGLLKGGKDGLVITSGNPEASELYKRVVLDPLEEKHMPPKGKPQLSERERVLLHWWIATGLHFTKKAKELEQPVAIKAALTAIEKSATALATKADIPPEAVEKASETTLAALRKAGVTILPVAANSNYLTASFVNLQQVNKTADSLLRLVKPQLIWLRMPGVQLSDAGWQTVASLDGLTRLSIEHSNISNGNLRKLISLKQLQYLNLVDTKITGDGLTPLKGLSQLANLYLAQTDVAKKDWFLLQKVFPKTKLDSGGYQVSRLATDTQLLVPTRVKK